MKACKLDLGALKANLANTIDNELRTLAIETSAMPHRHLPFSGS
jgi:hypothetical protein